VFDLIRENNLFTDVQDQALLLVEFDHELMEKRKEEEGLTVYEEHNDAITLLVDHIHSIPVSWANSHKPALFILHLLTG
jgi:vacuolar protein sorting-associated protein 41